MLVTMTYNLPRQKHERITKTICQLGSPWHAGLRFSAQTLKYADGTGSRKSPTAHSFGRCMQV